VDGQKITNRNEAGKLLEKLKSQRALLQTTIPSVPDVFFSAILFIDTENNFILIDELNKKAGHELLLIHKTLHIETKLDGIAIHFSCELIDTEVENGLHIYKFSFPDYLLYFQKRQSYRINIGLGTNIPVKFRREDGAPAYGHIFNLSETGAGIELDKPYRFQMSEILPYCEIRLDEGSTITCQLEIRYASKNQKAEQQRIGGKFIGMTNPDQRLIARLVIELQRDLMRHLPKDST